MILKLKTIKLAYWITNQLPEELQPYLLKILQHVCINRDKFDQDIYTSLKNLAGMKEKKKPKKNYVIETKLNVIVVW